VKAVEKAARAEIKALPAELRAGALATAVIELAKRLDAGPADREVAGVVRELRLSLVELHRRAGDDGASETETFVAKILTPSFGNVAH
jgi:hypothetical protein